jgi:hypothetical protein
VKKITLLTVLAATLSFAPSVSAHEGNEADEARAEHFLSVNWDARWLSRALVIGGLVVVGVTVYTMQRS